MRFCFSFLVVIFLFPMCVYSQEKNGTKAEDKGTVTVTSKSVTLVPEYDEVVAGEIYSFSVIVNQPPNFEGGVVQYQVADPTNVGLVNPCSPKKDDIRIYQCEYKVPAIGPSGIWTIKSVRFVVGTQQIPLTSRQLYFRVLPRPGVIVPSSAELAVNLSQKQLLRTEASHLQTRIQDLKSWFWNYKGSIRSGNEPAALADNLSEELRALAATQSEFQKLTTDENVRTLADTFFNDLGTTYRETISQIADVRAQYRSSRLLLVSGTEAGDSALLAVALRPLEQNVLAYTMVADSGFLAFDLEVMSSPSGANVSYHRRGDPPKNNDKPTNSTIRSLPLAIWILDFQKSGYRTVEREYDPFREPNRVISVELHR